MKFVYLAYHLHVTVCCLYPCDHTVCAESERVISAIKTYIEEYSETSVHVTKPDGVTFHLHFSLVLVLLCCS
jgi:hypothetical protein